LSCNSLFHMMFNRLIPHHLHHLFEVPAHYLPVQLISRLIAG
jgi:hypothetical protein